MATETGTVITISGGRAVVKTKKSEACAGCASQHACLVKGNDMEVTAVNGVGAGQGDDVVIQIQTRPFLKVTFMLYIFPILFLISGALLGENVAPRWGIDASLLSAVLGGVFFFVSIWIVKIMGKKMGEKEEYQPRIIRILKRPPAERTISETPST